MHLRLFNSNWIGIYLKRGDMQIESFLFLLLLYYSKIAEIEISTFESRAWNGPMSWIQYVHTISMGRNTMILAIFVFRSIKFLFYPWIPIDRIAFVFLNSQWAIVYTTQYTTEQTFISTVPYKIAILCMQKKIKRNRFDRQEWNWNSFENRQQFSRNAGIVAGRCHCFVK